jgi:hypothetical protein
MSFAEKNAGGCPAIPNANLFHFYDRFVSAAVPNPHDRSMAAHAAGHKTFTQGWEYILADDGLVGAGPKSAHQQHFIN